MLDLHVRCTHSIYMDVMKPLSDDLKETKNQLENIKADLTNENKNMTKEINKMKFKVNHTISDGGLLSRREKTRAKNFAANKIRLNEKLELCNKDLKKESAEGEIVETELQELQLLVNDQKVKDDILNNDKVMAKEYTAELRKLYERVGTV